MLCLDAVICMFNNHNNPIKKLSLLCKRSKMKHIEITCQWTCRLMEPECD